MTGCIRWMEFKNGWDNNLIFLLVNVFCIWWKVRLHACVDGISLLYVIHIMYVLCWNFHILCIVSLFVWDKYVSSPLSLLCPLLLYHAVSFQKERAAEKLLHGKSWALHASLVNKSPPTRHSHAPSPLPPAPLVTPASPSLSPKGTPGLGRARHDAKISLWPSSVWARINLQAGCKGNGG